MRGRLLLVVVGICLIFGGSSNAQAFQFLQPEYRMVEDAYQSLIQLEPAVTFDQSGNVHVMYYDGRGSGTSHIYGATLMPDGEITVSYRAYAGVENSPHIKPFIFPGTYFPSRCYVGCIDTSGTYSNCALGYFDGSSFPATPVPYDQSSCVLASSSIDCFETMNRSIQIYYVYDYLGDLYLNSFDETSGTWGAEKLVSSISPDENYSAPSFAMDDDGYIYLAYSVYNSLSTTTILRVRRSGIPGSISTWADERTVDSTSGSHAYEPKIAATGQYPSTLKVMIAYRLPSTTSQRIIGEMEENGNWTATVPEDFVGWGPYNISNSLGSTNTINGPDVVYDAAGDLYIVWSDDRNAVFQLYGNVRYDGGISMDFANEVQLGGGLGGIFGSPALAAGFYPGDIAVVYSRNNGMYTNPYLLVSRATFFDSCDSDPAFTGFWTAYSGVAVVTSMYYSPPGCYILGTGKGMLLRDFGTLEQQGSVTLQFYDSGSITEDFYVALNNDNLKGVIRMLGVRNDTTQSNYSYSYDGLNWIDIGGMRTVGWHEIRFDVNDSGLVMSIGLQGGGAASKSDPAFTSFTSIEMQGGSGTSPYFVDDIRVEAYPLVAAPPPLPASSLMTLLIAVIAIGLLILRKRSG